MKTKYLPKLLLALFINTASGLSAQTAESSSILVSGPKFTHSLIEKWISEYTKINPNSKIKLAPKASAAQDPDLNLIAHFSPNEALKTNHGIVFAGRYALLPVTNSKNPLLANAGKKGFSKNEIDKLFFEVINYDEEPVVEKSKFVATIYAPENQNRTATALAGYFGHVSSEIRGKKVMGDDIYLLNAIKKDSTGITFNNLGYLYDFNSRKLIDGIALLPLDLKKDIKSSLSGNVDDIIATLEKNQVETIPVERFGFVYSQQNTKKEVSDFLKWVLTDGQKFNHGYGFLNLESNELAEQNAVLNEKLLSLK
jgi:phosphate transport system substrate-binding protein